jgi:hypothetical protein
MSTPWALRQLLIDYAEARSFVVGETTTSFERDYKLLRFDLQERCMWLGIDYDENMIPEHVRDSLKMYEEDET